jgi:hypothetical protein
LSNRTDDFNRANSTSAMGTPSDAGSDWVAHTGTWGIISTSLGYTVSNTVHAAATLESSESDVDVEVTIQTVSAGVGMGLIGRFADTSNYLYFQYETGGTKFTLWKVVTNTHTKIGGDVVQTLNANDVMKLSMSGSALNCYVNDILVIGPISDSAGSSNTKHGLRTYQSSGTRFDDFSITGSGSITTQLLSPISDISAGTWLTSSGSPAELWQMLDGDNSPDTDYAYTTSAGTMEVQFSPASTPLLQTGHTLRYRLRGNGTCDALVKLKCGTTVIAQWTETNVPAVDTDYERTLDSSPSFTISDYSDLRISVEAVP